jgi:hypothetical protein
MSVGAMMGSLMKFVGYPVNSHIDAITKIAALNHFRVLILGPDSPANIDANEGDRLNVRQDKDGRIVSFSIG